MILKSIILASAKAKHISHRLLCRLISGWYSLQLKSCGKKLRLRTGSVIVSPVNITVGDSFESMECLYMYSDEGEINIGNNVSINTNVQIGASAGKIIIGNNVLIASNVVIRAADHGVKASEKINKQSHSTGIIVIEDDVWIGSNAVITSNVTLRKGTVVGAGAVVTKSTEPYSVVAGVPAKKIFERAD